MICVYSAEREILYGGTDSVARTSTVLATQPGFHIVPYETMIATPGPRLLIHRSEPWENWIEKSLQADGVHTTPIDNGLTGVELELSSPHRAPGRLEQDNTHARISVGNFQMTRERIRQIEAKVLRNLRRRSRSHKLKAFLDGVKEL